MLNRCFSSKNINFTPVHIYFTLVSATSIFNETGGHRTAKTFIYVAYSLFFIM